MNPTFEPIEGRFAAVTPPGQPSSHTRVGQRLDPAGSIGRALREMLFVVTLLLVWVTINPFADLGDRKLLEVDDTSNFLNQISFPLVGGCALIFLTFHPAVLQVLRRSVYYMMTAWLLISVVTSNNPELSAKRLLFTAFVIVLAAALLPLTSGLKRFADLLTAVVTAIIVLSYAGVMLAPSLSIHQPDDVVEPFLAGDWRGIFSHKNIAGPMMVIFIFIGLFVARLRNAILGWAIAIAAAVFLVLCGAKTAILVLPLALGASEIIMRLRSQAGQVVVIVGLLLTMQAMTLGTLFSDNMKSIVEAVMPDPTFTGRTEIWELAVSNVPNRPLFGHGFSAFWRSNDVISGSPTSKNLEGAHLAEHAHNGFLDLALTTGIPGLVLALLWTLVLPFRDLQRCKQVSANPALVMLFVRIWLFGIASSSFESVLFNRAEPLWFTMAVAMFGLRYLSKMRLSA